ncbi:MAG: hypothetical protein V5A44_13565 [Haloarculaceae archaeon]
MSTPGTARSARPTPSTGALPVHPRLTVRKTKPAGPSGPSRLEELGYRVPPESGATPQPTTTDENGTLYRLCGDCGAKNGVEFAR